MLNLYLFFTVQSIMDSGSNPDTKAQKCEIVSNIETELVKFCMIFEDWQRKEIEGSEEELQSLRDTLVKNFIQTKTSAFQT